MYGYVTTSRKWTEKCGPGDPEIFFARLPVDPTALGPGSISPCLTKVGWRYLFDTSPTHDSMH